MRRTGHSHPVQADPGSVCAEGPHYKDSLLESIQQFDAYYQQTYARHFTLPRGAVNLPQQPCLILGGGSGFFAKSLAYPIWVKKRDCAGRQNK